MTYYTVAMLVPDVELVDFELDMFVFFTMASAKRAEVKKSNVC